MTKTNILQVEKKPAMYDISPKGNCSQNLYIEQFTKVFRTLSLYSIMVIFFISSDKNKIKKKNANKEARASLFAFFLKLHI